MNENVKGKNKTPHKEAVTSFEDEEESMSREGEEEKNNVMEGVHDDDGAGDVKEKAEDDTFVWIFDGLKCVKVPARCSTRGR